MGKVRWGLFFLLVLDVFRVWGDDGRCSIPLKLRRGIPFVKVMLNGRGPFTFAVDTGTSGEAIVSPAVVKALNLAVVSRTWLLDLTGTERQAVDEVSLEILELAGHRFGPVRAMVHQPLATLGRYDGVLGFALFRQSILTLDFPGRCLRLEETGLAAGPDPNVLLFSAPRNVPVVGLTMGERTILAQVDSAGGGINLPASAASAVEFSERTEVPVRAQSQVAIFMLRGGVMKGELGLGGHVFRQPFVEIGEHIPVGNMGAISLQDFAVTFDQATHFVRFHAQRNVHRLYRSDLNEGTPPQAKRTAGTRGLEGGN